MGAVTSDTPLRYPGGKRRLLGVVTSLLEANSLSDIHYAEAFAGGASIPFALLFGEYAVTIHINDLSLPVYAFWHCVLNATDKLCARIEAVNVNIRQWRREREIYRKRA